GKIKRLILQCFGGLAEREGFEPSVPIRVQRFSRPPRSTAPAPLHGFHRQQVAYRCHQLAGNLPPAQAPTARPTSPEASAAPSAGTAPVWEPPAGSGRTSAAAPSSP